MKNIYLVIIGIIALLNTGCKKDNPANLPRDILSFWKFTGYGYQNNIQNIPDSVNIDLYIGSIYSEGNDFEGESSFRNYWGRFKLAGNEINFYDLRVTDVLTYADSVSYFEIEKKFLNALIKCKRYVVDQDVLTMYFVEDSSLVFEKNTSTAYSDSYEFSALFDGQEWLSDSNSTSMNIDKEYGSGIYYNGLNGSPVLKYSDGQYYDIGIQIYYPPKNGTYYENDLTLIHAYSFIKGDPNTNRAESSSGYLKIDRVSRSFISGEFEFHMVQIGMTGSKEFNITSGKFKAEIHSSGMPLYISYK